MLNLFKRKNHIVITVIVFLLTFFAMGYTAYANLDRFISPKSYYLMVESKNSISALQEIPKLYNEADKTSQIQKKLNISFNSNLKNIESFAMFDEIINKFNLVMKINSNEKEEISICETLVNYDNKELLSSFAFKNKNILGLKIPKVYDKFFIIDEANINTTFNKLLGVDIKAPQKTISQKEIKEALDINNEVFYDIFFEYMRIYEDSINKDNVTLQRNSYITDKSGQKVDCTAINITFDQQTFKGMLVKWLEIFQDNEALTKQIVTSNNNLYTLFKDAGYQDFELSELTEQEVSDKINELVQIAKSKIEQISIIDKINLTVYVDSKDKIIQRTLKMDSKDIDGINNDSFVAIYKNIGDKEKAFENSFEFQSKSALSENSFSISNSYKLDSITSKRVGSLVVAINQSSGDEEEKDISFGIDYKVNLDEKSDSGLLTGEYALKINNSLAQTVPFADITLNISKNAVPAGFTYDFCIKGEVGSESKSDYSLNVIVDSQELLPNELTLPYMSTDSFVDLNNIDEAEVEQIVSDIQKGIEKLQFEIFYILAQ